MFNNIFSLWKTKLKALHSESMRMREYENILLLYEYKIKRL